MPQARLAAREVEHPLDVLGPTTIPAVAPNPAIRALWSQLVSQESEDDFWRSFRALYRLSENGHGVEVVQQGLVLSAGDDQAVKMFVPGMYIPMLRLWPDIVLRAAVPMLESSDAGQREQAEMLIEGLLASQVRWIADEDVRDYYKVNHPEPPRRFVTFLSSFAPRTALLSLDDSYPEPERHRVVIWAEHVIADAIWQYDYGFLKRGGVDAAKKQLKLLARRPEWWVRLYASEIVRIHPWLAE